MRVNKAQLEAAIRGLNALCARLGLPAGYHIDKAYGGYKLVQGEGERDVWHDRTTAREFYSRVWAFREGMETAARVALTRDDLALVEGMAAELLDAYKAQGKGQGTTAGDKLDRARLSDMLSLKAKVGRMIDAILQGSNEPTNGN